LDTIKERPMTVPPIANEVPEPVPLVAAPGKQTL
jgi:hypothetical protein